MTKKEKFLRELNEAFARSDTQAILDAVTDDVRWTMVGESMMEGKEAVAEALLEMEMEEPLDMTIESVITHGTSASVEGRMKLPNGSEYAFCDVYKLRDHKNPLVRELRAYVIELPKQEVA